MTVQTSKETYSRLNIRLKTRSKEWISKAAYILGQDLTEFSETILTEKAREVIENYEQFELTEAEKKAFFEIIDGPIPESTEYSLKEAKKFKRMVKKGQLRV